MSDYQRFRQLILNEMQRRDMSMRQFAEMLGYSSSTFVRFLDDRVDAKPSIELITRLAKVVERPEDVLEVAFPDLQLSSDVSLTAKQVARRFDTLSDDLKMAILAILDAADAAKRRSQNE